MEGHGILRIQKNVVLGERKPHTCRVICTCAGEQKRVSGGVVRENHCSGCSAEANAEAQTQGRTVGGKQSKNVQFTDSGQSCCWMFLNHKIVEMENCIAHHITDTHISSLTVLYILVPLLMQLLYCRKLAGFWGEGADTYWLALN